MRIPDTCNIYCPSFNLSTLGKITASRNELQRLQREVETELASFTPALLAKAFRGEL